MLLGPIPKKDICARGPHWQWWIIKGIPVMGSCGWFFSTVLFGTYINFPSLVTAHYFYLVWHSHIGYVYLMYIYIWLCINVWLLACGSKIMKTSGLPKKTGKTMFKWVFLEQLVEKLSSHGSRRLLCIRRSDLAGQQMILNDQGINQSINQSINQCFIVFHDVLMMYLWCTYDVLMMYLWCFMFSQFIIVYHLLIIGKCWMIRWWTTEGLGGIRNENMQKTHFQTPFSGDTLKLVFHWRWIFMFPLPLLLGHRCWSRISRKTNLSGGFLKSGYP